MQTKTNLKIDWATHEAAKYAVENWHYSRCMPKSKLVKVGVWEDGKYIGVVLFGMGATPNLCKPYGLEMTEVAELVRIALRDHATPVTRIVSIAIRFLKNQSPGLRLIISFADTNQGHHGGIYQGGNWLYSGMTEKAEFIRLNGKLIHPRQISRLNKKDPRIAKNAEKVVQLGKHRYLMPLDEIMRQQIEPLRKPYPKRATSKGNVAPGFQPGEGGVIPTVALHKQYTGKKAVRLDGKT